jgi:hypothetical protein
MEVDTNRTQARSSPSPQGGRKRSAVEAPKVESGDDEYELAGNTLSHLANLCKQLRNDLEHETSRRRDLRDELENEKLGLSSNIMKTDSNVKAIQKAMQVLSSEGEHKDNVRILVIKKRNMNMGPFLRTSSASRTTWSRMLQLCRSRVLDLCGKSKRRARTSPRTSRTQ